MPKLTIGNLVIGNLSTAQAADKISGASPVEKELTINIDDQSFKFNPKDADIKLDADATAQRALEFGSSNNPFTSAYYRIQSFFEPVRTVAVVTFDETKFDEQLTKILVKVNQSAKETALSYDDGNWKVQAGTAGKKLDKLVLKAAILDRMQSINSDALSLQTSLSEPQVTVTQAQALIPQATNLASQDFSLTTPTTTITLTKNQYAPWVSIVLTTDTGVPSLTLDQTKVQDYFHSLGQQLNTEPVDGRLSFVNGQLTSVQMSHNGQTLNEGESVKALVAAFIDSSNRKITLPFDVKKPDINSEQLDALGLKELIGTAMTNYDGSPDNRKHNISNGAKFLTGKLIKPGDEFSVVTALGKVDDTTGYLPELVIKDNTTKPEYGGGLCQVSTTLFRAAMNAGLRITERANHSYRVSYYEKGVGPGLDATIYLPQPDLKFLNDTPGYVLIQATVDEKKNNITFDLYGTKDGRTSEVGKPNVYNITDPPEPVYIQTPDLPAGETKQTDKAHSGATTDVTYKVYRDGKVINEQHFHSFYKAWAAKYLVGTGGVPVTTETAAPTPTSSPAQ